MQNPTESAIKKLAWNLETQESVDLLVTTQIHHLEARSGGSLAFDSFDEHYIATGSDRRFLEFRSLKSGTLVSRSLHYGDRGKFTDINFPADDAVHQQSVYVTNNFFLEDKNDRKQIPQPLLFFYVGRKPLHEALPAAEYLGTGECLGRECDRFLFTQVRWARPVDQVFFLDQKTAVPLKVETFLDKSAREEKRPAGVWEAKSLDSVQGHDLALKSSLTEFTKEGKPSLRWELSVDRIEFNKEIPASTFQPVLQPGVTILDSTTKKMTQAPGGKPITSADSATAATTRPIEATPPRDWSSAVPATGFVIGLSCLAVGLVSWCRRR